MAQPRHKWNPICLPPRGLVRPVPIDPSGGAGPTRGQAYGPKWRQTTRGLYVPSRVTAKVPEQRVLEQAMRLPGGAVTGWGSCRLQRANFFDGLMKDGQTRLPVPLCTGPLSQIRDCPGSKVSRDRLLAEEVVVIEASPAPDDCVVSSTPCGRRLTSARRWWPWT